MEKDQKENSKKDLQELAKSLGLNIQPWQKEVYEKILHNVKYNYTFNYVPPRRGKSFLESEILNKLKNLDRK